MSDIYFGLSPSLIVDRNNITPTKSYFPTYRGSGTSLLPSKIAEDTHTDRDYPTQHHEAPYHGPHDNPDLLDIDLFLGTFAVVPARVVRVTLQVPVYTAAIVTFKLIALTVST